jgi:hypothetical protein
VVSGQWSVRVRVFASLLGLVVAFGILASTALADATPVQLVLIYMPNVSNTGTPTASGIAELVMPEGEVRINAADLPRLDSEKQYVAWVINTETNDFQRLAAFNTAESSKTVHYETVLADAIPNRHWNLLLVTVEDSGQAARPSSQHSIAGVFPSPDNAPLPIVLPNTGGEPVVSGQWSVVSWAERLSNPGLATLTLGLGAVAGYVVGRRHALRPQTTDHRQQTTDD